MNPKQKIENLMLSILPEHVEDNKIQRVRNILGNNASQISDEEIEISLVQFEYLVNSWLDEFERNIFEKKTLQEILRTQ
ncbi:MAG TPA: hypothetical protein VNW29_06260 [Candidatus Sulfotelmatobacter sp.]|jgi:hypothetical protein|nr:hypothetical protein [Candidatus Sulfotelmatobacter sp.]